MSAAVDKRAKSGLDHLNNKILQAALVGFAGSMPVSIAFCQISLGVGWLSWLASCWRRRRWLGNSTGLEPALVSFLAACTLATILSPQPLASLLGMKKFYLASALYWVAYGCRSIRDGRKLVLIFIYFSTLTAAYGLLLHFVGIQERVTGTQTMALTAGGIFMMAGLMSAVLAMEGKAVPRWLSIACSLVLGAGTVFSQSAGSLFSFFAALITVLAISKKWKLLVPVSVVLVLLAAAFLALPVGKGSTVEAQKANTWQLRKTIWGVGWRVIAERPVTGHGLVDLGDAYRRNREEWDLARDPWGAWNYGHLHNNFLQVAAISGLVGLAAFVFLLFSVLRIGLRACRAADPEARALALAAVGATIGFMLNGFTEWNFGDSEVVTVFWFSAGILSAIGAGSRVAERAGERANA